MVYTCKRAIDTMRVRRYWKCQFKLSVEFNLLTNTNISFAFLYWPDIKTIEKMSNDDIVVSSKLEIKSYTIRVPEISILISFWSILFDLVLMSVCFLCLHICILFLYTHLWLNLIDHSIFWRIFCWTKMRWEHQKTPALLLLLRLIS